MKNKYKELYELKLSEFQLTMCNLSIEEDGQSFCGFQSNSSVDRWWKRCYWILFN